MITAKPETVGLSSKRLERVNDLVSGYIERQDLAGAITLVARRGEVVHFQCSGVNNIETGEALRQDHIFNIFSMTKPITAVAVLILYERGFFQLDTPVSKFIPEFKNIEVLVGGTIDDYKTVKPQREMNIWDLLTHTSGLSYDLFNKSIVEQMYQRDSIGAMGLDTTMAEFVQKVAKLPLLFSPGTKWCYSISSDVLGYIVEVISGMPFDEFVDREICQPLGMIDTGYTIPEESYHRIGHVHINRKSMSKNIPDTYPEIESYSSDLRMLDGEAYSLLKRKVRPKLFQGGGGMVSTISDYLIFLQMLLNKGRFGDEFLLSPKTVGLMTTNNLPGDIPSMAHYNLGLLSPKGYGYGFGVAVMMDPVKANAVGTRGEYFWFGASHTSFFVDPKEELIGIVMASIFPPGIHKIHVEFKEAVYQSVIDSNCR